MFTIFYSTLEATHEAQPQEKKITQCGYQEVVVTGSYFRRDLDPLGPEETCEVVLQMWVSIFTVLPQRSSSQGEI